MNCENVSGHIVEWLASYSEKSKTSGFVIGISGGIDSALTSTLCALTSKKTILVNMPIRQTEAEYMRALLHIKELENRFSNVSSLEINLSPVFGLLEETLPHDVKHHDLAMANSRSRLRMTTLYAIAQTHGCLVAGTGNKVEDFGVGFFTKYGDGGVDISPIADLTKTEVKELAAYVQVVEEILVAKPTDGLWNDGRSDEDQLGATYPELEWAMEFNGDFNTLNNREKEVINIFKKLNSANKHKMESIPVCSIPLNIK